MTKLIQLSGKKQFSVSVQALATIGAIISAVVLPQIFHWLGIVSGSGMAPGIVFSPMHLPIIAAGLLAGPYVGEIAGALAPIVAYFISGMPTAAQLPFMIVELSAYGLTAGLLRFVKMPTVVKVFIAMIIGRVARMAAVFVAVKFFASSMSVFEIWKSVPRCLPGIVLQLVLIPMFVYWVETKNNN